jgi:hypothetical protein
MMVVGEVEESAIPEPDCGKLDLGGYSMVHGGDRAVKKRLSPYFLIHRKSAASLNEASNSCKHVLGVDTDHPGIYGDTSAYYGTVEQQGHLTLHLHLLLWIKGNLSPQEMRKHILDPNSQFQQDLVSYLESLQVGEFLTGTQSEVVQQVEHLSKSQDYVDPTQTLPTPPPSFCSKICGTCRDCNATVKWMHKYVGEVDDLLSKSNVHCCPQAVTTDSNVKA